MKHLKIKRWAGLLVLSTPSLLMASSESTEVGVSFQIDSAAQIAVIGDELQWAIAAPSTAGGSIYFPHETFVQYLQYTSVADSWNSTRKITVERSSTSGFMPAGILLYLIPEQEHVGTQSGGELGQIGTGVMLEAGLMLGSNVLVDGIQTAWTGDGPEDGVRLNYSLGMNGVNIYELASGLHNSIDLVFTISDSQ